GLLTGRVDRAWAARHHPAWLDEKDRSGLAGRSEGVRNPESPAGDVREKPPGNTSETHSGT
ncbi:hypothetical protein ACFQ07_05380, partial [Actinomadura adrarensis]